MVPAPFPAVASADLGELVLVQVDAALIPYLLGLVPALADADLYDGTPADVEATVYAVEELIARLVEIV